MISVWEEIEFLCCEARLALELDGYDQKQGMDAITSDDDTEIVGALVYAYDAAGCRAQESVWYPEGWCERETREQAERERGRHLRARARR